MPALQLTFTITAMYAINSGIKLGVCWAHTLTYEPKHCNQVEISVTLQLLLWPHAYPLYFPPCGMTRTLGGAPPFLQTPLSKFFLQFCGYWRKVILHIYPFWDRSEVCICWGEEICKFYCHWDSGWDFVCCFCASMRLLGFGAAVAIVLPTHGISSRASPVGFCQNLCDLHTRMWNTVTCYPPSHLCFFTHLLLWMYYICCDVYASHVPPTHACLGWGGRRYPSHFARCVLPQMLPAWSAKSSPQYKYLGRDLTSSLLYHAAYPCHSRELWVKYPHFPVLFIPTPPLWPVTLGKMPW